MAYLLIKLTNKVVKSMKNSFIWCLTVKSLTKMKKLLLFSAVAAFAFTTAQSQEVSFGVKAGLNLSNLAIKPNDGDKPDARTSFHIGGLVEIPITEKFSVQPEILYSSQGAKNKEKDEGYTTELTFKLDYISLPIMAKYYVIDNLALELGPQFNLLMSAKADLDYSIAGQSGTESVDLKDQFKKLDIGLGFGASYALDMGVFFGARYNLGLTDINDGKDPDFDDNPTIKNNVFQISAGYKF